MTGPNPRNFDVVSLSIAERIVLAQQLWDSVHADAHAAPFTPEQLAEIDRRIAPADAGEMAEIPWEMVRQRILPEP